MNKKTESSYGGWMSFVDNWAAYHNVRLTENARDALANASLGAFGPKGEADYAQEKAFRAAHPQYRQTVAEPVQTIAKPAPARIARTAPPAATPTVPARGRIVRRPTR